jgi:hypothetical protein
LPAEHARRESPPAVARALVDRDDPGGRELRPEVADGQLERAVHAAVHLEAPRTEVHLGGDREDVVAHEERLVRRDGPVEVRHRGLELGRARREQDQIGLLGIAHERTSGEDRIPLRLRQGGSDAATAQQDTADPAHRREEASAVHL